MAADFYIGAIQSVHRRDTRPDWAMHGQRRGPSRVFLLTLQGRADYTVDDEHFVINPGDMMILPENCRREAYCLPGQQWIFASAILMLHGDTSELPMRAHIGLYPGQRLLAEAQKAFDMDDMLLARARLSELFHVYRQQAVHDMADGRLAGIIEELRRRPATSDVSLERLADEAGLSPSRFRVLFKAATGMPFHHWQTRRRLLYARRLLLRQTHTVAEAAEAIGIDDQHYFSRLFKKHFGLPPSACRE